MFERLISEMADKPTMEICQYYTTISKIKDSYAKTRQLYPADIEISRLYEDASKIEKLLQDIIIERFLRFKKDESEK